LSPDKKEEPWAKNVNNQVQSRGVGRRRQNIKTLPALKKRQPTGGEKEKVYIVGKWERFGWGGGLFFWGKKQKGGKKKGVPGAWRSEVSLQTRTKPLDLGIEKPGGQTKGLKKKEHAALRTGAEHVRVCVI